MTDNNDEITLIAGTGGNGLASFYPAKKSGPDGGNGGNGGNIYIYTDKNYPANELVLVNKTYKAGLGGTGGKNQKSGKNGEDIAVHFPKGTTLENTETGEKIELNKEDEKILICKGGMGGTGNYVLRSPTNTTPKYFLPGLPGEKKIFKIKYCVPGEIAIIGFPNSGKTSIFNELTNARGKVTDYPFGTIKPDIGTFENKVIIDLPPIVSRSHLGKGIGNDFLKHLKYIKIILICLSVTEEEIVKIYNEIIQEIKIYDKEFLKKKIIILLTKTDEIDEKKLKSIKIVLKRTKKSIIPVSILNEKLIFNLKKKITVLVNKKLK